MSKFILHAPNVWTGGGAVLLKELLDSGVPIDVAVLDERIAGEIDSRSIKKCIYTKRTLLGRLKSEATICKEAGCNYTVLCFHGLPPLLPVKGRVAVFVQNRALLYVDSLKTWPLKVALRIFVERLWASAMAFRVDRFYVQTESMKQLVIRTYKPSLSPIVIPFSDLRDFEPLKNINSKKNDFTYIASGDAHKNHINLFKAWAILAKKGVYPSLFVTLGNMTEEMNACLEAARCLGADIENRGELGRTEVASLYRDSKAIIYPSFSESFGLPLLEAAQAGLPIIAAELDYVRDVVTPEQTFDPHSAVSIARSVARFLEFYEPTIKVKSAEQFLRTVCSE